MKRPFWVTREKSDSVRGIEIDKSKETARVKLNLFFYPDKYIQQAAQKFARICKTKISYKADYVLLELTPKNKGIDAEKAAHEFVNFLLEVIQNEE